MYFSPFAFTMDLSNVFPTKLAIERFGHGYFALQKLRGKAGQQKVTVEHVHVHQGGQAIVGAVSVSKDEGGGEKSSAETISP
jgi:hypothetical protein